MQATCMHSRDTELTKHKEHDGHMQRTLVPNTIKEHSKNTELTKYKEHKRQADFVCIVDTENSPNTQGANTACRHSELTKLKENIKHTLSKLNKH